MGLVSLLPQFYSDHGRARFTYTVVTRTGIKFPEESVWDAIDFFSNTDCVFAHRTESDRYMAAKMLKGMGEDEQSKRICREISDKMLSEAESSLRRSFKDVEYVAEMATEAGMVERAVQIYEGFNMIEEAEQLILSSGEDIQIASLQEKRDKAQIYNDRDLDLPPFMSSAEYELFWGCKGLCEKKDMGGASRLLKDSGYHRDAAYLEAQHEAMNGNISKAIAIFEGISEFGGAGLLAEKEESFLRAAMDFEKEGWFGSASMVGFRLNDYRRALDDLEITGVYEQCLYNAKRVAPEREPFYRALVDFVRTLPARDGYLKKIVESQSPQ